MVFLRNLATLGSPVNEQRGTDGFPSVTALPSVPRGRVHPTRKIVDNAPPGRLD